MNTTTEKMIEIKVNQGLWKKFKKKAFISTAEFIIRLLTVVAVFLFFGSIIAMIETFSPSTAQIITCIICFVWMCLVGLYVYWVNKD